MAAEVKRINLEPETDVLRILEEVHTDKVPRLIERDGKALAVVVSPDEYVGADVARPEGPKNILSFAGIWSDLDGERMIEEIYRARHEAPPSPAVEP